VIGVAILGAAGWIGLRIEVIRRLQQRHNAVVALTLFQIANKRKLDAVKLAYDLYRVGGDAARKDLMDEIRAGNPLSHDEALELDGYRRKMDARESFSIAEARRFRELTGKWTEELGREKSDKVGAFLLGAVAGAILVGALGQSATKRRRRS
jgi:hypothetical protein